MGTFTGFGDAAVDFYEGLEADNTKAYWSDHRHLYDDHVRAPMLALLADLAAEFGAGKVFRPHRDVRFSADKTPYKVQCGATSGSGGYVSVSADGLFVAAGMYRMAPAQVARYRAAVDDDRLGGELEGIVDAVRAEGDTIEGDTLKTRPRGVDPDHPRLDLLRHRSLFAAHHWPPDDALHSPAVVDRVATTWRRLDPLVRWLQDHVGHLPDDDPRRPGGR